MSDRDSSAAALGAAPSTGGAVPDVVDGLRRRIQAHGGDLRLEDAESDGQVRVRFSGACRGCPALAVTYHSVVRPALLEAADGPADVHCDQVRVSPHAARRLEGLWRNRWDKEGADE